MLTARPDGRTRHEHRSWEEARRWRRTGSERRTLEAWSRLHRTRVRSEAAG